MFLARFAAAVLAGSALFGAGSALAASSQNDDLIDLYTKGYIRHRPLFTEFYETLPSAYFPGLPPMKTASFDHSNCRPILPDHIARLSLTPPPGYEPMLFDCSIQRRPRTASNFNLYNYMPLYPFVSGRPLSYVTSDGQQHSLEILPPRFVGQHPYDIRSGNQTTVYNPWLGQ
ncbi:MAG TPA: hypothetical protein VI913_05200 [Candidatus Peribacteraceae bacterium]|nr:hypothetical protein [Candidatus Peribacteraceae bacterium]